MRGFAAVFRREVAERWRLFPAAGLLSLVPLLLPLFAASWRQDAAFMRSATGVMLGLASSGVLALILGSSIVARDLADRRLGFYFARPLAGWAIWAGKMAAAVALAAGAGFLVLLPGGLAGNLFGGPAAGSATAGELANDALLWTAGVLLLVLLCHAGSIALRSRSPWLLADLAAAAVTPVLVWLAARKLTVEGASTALAMPLPLLAALLPAALLAASAAQVVRGRTELRRGHHLLSLVLWTPLLGAALGFAAYSRWVLDVSPASLADIQRVKGAPRGTWILLDGAVSRGGGFRSVFLLEAAAGRFIRMRAPDAWAPWPFPLEFSADGRRAAWLEPLESLASSPLELACLDLSRPGARVLHPPIFFAGRPVLALSPDGSRLAAVDEQRVTVNEIATGRLLASVALPAHFGFGWQARFVARDRVRIFIHASGSEAENPTLRIFELDVTGRRMTVLATTSEASFMHQVSPDGERILSPRHGRAGYALLDARSGRLMATLGQPGRQTFAHFLAGGGIVAVDRGAGPRELRVFDANGLPVSGPWRLPGGDVPLRLGGEPAAGRLVVAIGMIPYAADPYGAAPYDTPAVANPHGADPYHSAMGRGAWTSILLDLGQGTSRLLGRWIEPLGAPSDGPGTLRAQLFTRGGSGLLWLDAATGRERWVVPPR